MSHDTQTAIFVCLHPISVAFPSPLRITITSAHLTHQKDIMANMDGFEVSVASSLTRHPSLELSPLYRQKVCKYCEV
jgi:hypothetical protein